MEKYRLFVFFLCICFTSCEKEQLHDDSSNGRYGFLELGYYKMLSDDFGVSLYNNNLYLISNSSVYTFLRKKGEYKIILRNSEVVDNIDIDSFRLDSLYVSTSGFSYRNDTVSVEYEGITEVITAQDINFQTSFYMNDFKGLLKEDVLYNSYIEAKSTGYSFQYLHYLFLLDENHLYIIMDNSIDPKPFMLHFLMPDGSFVNKDFVFGENRIDDKFFDLNRGEENKKIARISIRINERYYPLQIGEYYRNLDGKPILFWHKKMYPTKILGNKVMRNTAINEN